MSVVGEISIKNLYVFRNYITNLAKNYVKLRYINRLDLIILFISMFVMTYFSTVGNCFDSVVMVSKKKPKSNNNLNYFTKIFAARCYFII
jgi:hypothetical protein